MTFDDLRSELNQQRAVRDRAEETLRRAREALRTISAHKARLVRLGLEDSEAHRDLVDRQIELEDSIEAVREEHANARDAADDLAAELTTTFPPHKAIANWDDTLPVLLLPVRLETRVRVREDGASELLLRIWPDDAHVASHEDQVTAGELTALRGYCDAVNSDVPGRLGAFRALCARFGPNRATWLVDQCTADAEGNLTPKVDELDTRLESWSKPPRALILPEQFVAIGSVEGTEVILQLGNRIPDPLIVGPDPAPLSAETEGFRESTEDLRVDDAMRWMVDFDEAVRVGMGMRIPLEGRASAGLDRLLVVGLRLADAPEAASAALSRLVEDHRFSEKGFGLVPQGTPTNNTGGESAGHTPFSLAADDAFELALGPRRFEVEGDWRHERDGQVLADALGIDPAVLQRVQHADEFDRRDARAMNAALWPATLGYFLEELMDPLFSRDTIEATHDFFVRHVSGRGVAPAVRVGPQPYGVLVTSAFSRWRASDEGFEARLHDFLARLDETWDRQVAAVARVGRSGDPHQTLLDVLGLHASSAEFHHRFAVDLEHVDNLLKLGGLGPEALDIVMLMRASWSDLLSDFGMSAGGTPAIFHKIFQNEQTRLSGPLVHEPGLSDTNPLPPLSQDGESYLTWLATSDPDTLRREDFGRRDGEPIRAPRALLYLLLRQAALNSFWDTAWNLVTSSQTTDAPPPRVEPPLLYLRDRAFGRSKLELLYRPAGELAKAYPRVFPDPDRSVAEQLGAPGALTGTPGAKRLNLVRDAITALAGRPTRALARAFSEHIDLCSYRIDAWKLGLPASRLARARGGGKKGLYLGAFGWLEDVRAKRSVSAYTGDVPEGFNRPGEAALTVDEGNAGHIHAPSLGQAAAASVLRNAYVSHREDDPGIAAVDLTSDRVRTALSLVEGVNNGQPLGALLGYRFERGLHERHPLAEVDRFIFPLRKQFPLVADRITESSDSVPIERLEARNVVDGYALVRHVHETGERHYPFGLAGLPEATEAQARALDAALDLLDRALDAVSDLYTAEGVFQVVSGNAERAAAALDALSRSGNLPAPEVVRTPRSGTVLTHRIGLRIPPSVPESDRNPYAEQGLPRTPRSDAEPGLNLWLSGILGADMTRTGTRARFEVPAEGEEPGRAGDTFVSVADLGLQPIDLVHLLDRELSSGASELDARIALVVRARELLPATARVTIRYTELVAGYVTLFELMPLVHDLRGLVVGGRALHGGDLRLPSERPDSAGAASNPHGWEEGNLRARVEATAERLASVQAALDAARATVAGGRSDATAVSALRTSLVNSADFGVSGAIPVGAIDTGDEVARDLVAQANRVLEEIAERLSRFGAARPDPSVTSIRARIQRWMDAGAALLGPSFTWIPTFRIERPADIERAHTGREALLHHARSESPLPVEDWLSGVAKVREKVGHLHRARLLAEAFGSEPPALTPLQVPYRDKDPWLAVAYPPDHVVDGDRLLLSMVLAAPLDPSGPQAGLLLDEWTEVVPGRNETTGIAFHYDAPASEPPQTWIVAVSPDVDGSWQWEDLVATLHETLDMAKKRAVEPAQIDDTRIAQLLPATMLPVTRHFVTVATNLLANMEVAPVATDVPSGE